MHEANSFITLTYDDDHLPNDFSLNKEHFPKFIRRVRKKLGNKKIRYFHCGEYGEENYRPHYHACIFGYDFPDKRYLKTVNGNRYYNSDFISECWPYGFNLIGNLNFESAAYVARYVVKKVNGKNAEKHYQRVDPETGEVYQVQPEYCTMSRRPGIGKAWLDKYESDVYPEDNVVIRGVKLKPPRYYDQKYDGIEDIKIARMEEQKKHRENNTKERLEVQETCTKARLNQLRRNIV